MQLRDTIELWGYGPDGEDPYGDPIPGMPEKLKTVNAQVYFATASLEWAQAGGNRLQAIEKLRAIIEDPDVELAAGKNWIVWKGEKYSIDGVLERVARGKTHHFTLELTQFT